MKLLLLSLRFYRLPRPSAAPPHCHPPVSSVAPPTHHHPLGRHFPPTPPASGGGGVAETAAPNHSFFSGGDEGWDVGGEVWFWIWVFYFYFLGVKMTKVSSFCSWGVDVLFFFFFFPRPWCDSFGFSVILFLYFLLSPLCMMKLVGSSCRRQYSASSEG